MIIYIGLSTITDKFSIDSETSERISNIFLADTESEFSIATVPYKKSI